MSQEVNVLSARLNNGKIYSVIPYLSPGHGMITLRLSSKQNAPPSHKGPAANLHGVSRHGPLKLGRLKAAQRWRGFCRGAFDTRFLTSGALMQHQVIHYVGSESTYSVWKALKYINWNQVQVHVVCIFCWSIQNQVIYLIVHVSVIQQNSCKTKKDHTKQQHRILLFLFFSTVWKEGFWCLCINVRWRLQRAFNSIS